MPGPISQRSGEFSASYANRVSSEEVEGRIERLTGERLLSDQPMWSQVVERAASISQPWAEETATLDPIEPASPVDGYDGRAPEVFGLSDGIQVNQQKPRRDRSGQLPAEQPQRERVRVNTDVWMVERAGGGFRSLTAGVNRAGEERVSVEARVQQCLQAA